MPDLRREQRLRDRFNLDLPVDFTIATGGTRTAANGFRYEPIFEIFRRWCRREDPQPADVYSTDSGTRDAGDISLVTRFDSRLAPSTDNSFVVDGTRYTLSAIERIGRDRYMRLSGVFSS